MNDRLFGALPVGAREAVRVLRRQAGVASAGLALSSLGVFFLAATFLPRDVDPRFVGSFLLVVGLASCAGLWILGRRRARVELSLPLPSSATAPRYSSRCPPPRRVNRRIWLAPTGKPCREKSEVARPPSCFPSAITAGVGVG